MFSAVNVPQGECSSRWTFTPVNVARGKHTPGWTFLAVNLPRGNCKNCPPNIVAIYTAAELCNCWTGVYDGDWRAAKWKDVHGKREQLDAYNIRRISLVKYKNVLNEKDINLMNLVSSLNNGKKTASELNEYSLPANEAFVLSTRAESWNIVKGQYGLWTDLEVIPIFSNCIGMFFCLFHEHTEPTCINDLPRTPTYIHAHISNYCI